ncbi:MAG TPA: hypothetical protein VN622_17375 [Clostridia bacterium]|nr:hypothetical protein [Clostridia bacterium]
MKGPAPLPFFARSGEGASATSKLPAAELAASNASADARADDQRARVQSIRNSLGNLAYQMVAATELPKREALQVLSTGIAPLDAVVSGLPRGALTEIYGSASSGRTSVLLASLAAATGRGEVCALVDTTDSFDPESAAAAGVELSQLLWIRCNGAQQAKEKRTQRFAGNDFGGHDLLEKPAFVPRADKIARSKAFRRLEQALKITDLLLQAGGFGIVAIDMADLPDDVARRVPLTSWFRFRRAVENTPTSLLVIEREAYARACASLVLRFERARARRSQVSVSSPTHAMLLRGIEVDVEVIRSPESAGFKKPVQSAHFIARVRDTA